MFRAGNYVKFLLLLLILFFLTNKSTERELEGKESEYVNKKKDWLLYAIVFVIGWCIGELLMKL